MRNISPHRSASKLLLILALPFILIAALFIFWLFLLFASIFMKIVFGVGDLSAHNDDMVWLWQIHFFPYGLLASVVLLAMAWVAYKLRHRGE